jgi:hypothetical protein
MSKKSVVYNYNFDLGEDERLKLPQRLQRQLKITMTVQELEDLLKKYMCSVGDPDNYSYFSTEFLVDQKIITECKHSNVKYEKRESPQGMRVYEVCLDCPHVMGFAVGKNLDKVKE